MHNRKMPAGVWVLAVVDALAGIFLLRTMNGLPRGNEDGLGAFDWLVFLLNGVNALLLLLVCVCLITRRTRALRLAVGLQRWAGWAFVFQAVASVGLSFVIVNDSMSGTFAFLGGLFLLLPAILCFGASRYLAGFQAENGKKQEVSEEALVQPETWPPPPYNPTASLPQSSHWGSKGVPLTHTVMADRSRCFICLPEVVSWAELRDHIVKMPGAVVTKYLTDEITEVWIDFKYRGYAFSVNNQFGEYWFFVSKRNCPDNILVEIAEHCASITGV